MEAYRDSVLPPFVTNILGDPTEVHDSRMGVYTSRRMFLWKVSSREFVDLMRVRTRGRKGYREDIAKKSVVCVATPVSAFRFYRPHPQDRANDHIHGMKKACSRNIVK